MGLGEALGEETGQKLYQWQDQRHLVPFKKEKENAKFKSISRKKEWKEGPKSSYVNNSYPEVSRTCS